MREIKFRFLNPYYDTTFSQDASGFFIYGSLDDIREDVDGYYSTDCCGQCTGIKDKNGNEIYEGDILKDIFGRLCAVRYDTDLGSCGCCYDRFSGSGFIVDGEVIVGNIYENPEMLDESHN